MAKSAQQKKEEAIERGRKKYFNYVEYFLMYCPSFRLGKMDHTELAVWLNHFKAMRRRAKELSINWDGTEIYSTIENWTLRQIVELWTSNPEVYMDDIDRATKYLESVGRRPVTQLSRSEWQLRNTRFKELLGLPEIQELIDLLDNQ